VDDKLKFFINLDTDKEMTLKVLVSLFYLLSTAYLQDNRKQWTEYTHYSERFLIPVLIGTHLYCLIT
jgi:hypothetical protein